MRGAGVCVELLRLLSFLKQSTQNQQVHYMCTVLLVAFLFWLSLHLFYEMANKIIATAHKYKVK